MLEPTLKSLKPFSDSRGFSFFNVFPNIDGGQINIGHLYSPAIKAFHKHQQQWDHWICIKGNIHVITFQNGKSDAKHFYFGENNPCILSIPTEWYHGYQNIGCDHSTLLYWVTKEYDPYNADEQRLSWDILGKDIWQPENK